MDQEKHDLVRLFSQKLDDGRISEEQATWFLKLAREQIESLCRGLPSLACFKGANSEFVPVPANIEDKFQFELVGRRIFLGGEKRFTVLKITPSPRCLGVMVDDCFAILYAMGAVFLGKEGRDILLGDEDQIILSSLGKKSRFLLFERERRGQIYYIERGETDMVNSYEIPEDPTMPVDSRDTILCFIQEK